MVNSGLNLTASKVMEAIGGQLNEFVDDYLNVNGMSYEYDLLEPFETWGWLDSAAYQDMQFEYEWAAFSFRQLCNLVEMMFGARVEDQFYDELTEQVKNQVQIRVDFHRMQRDADEQVKLNHELKEDMTA